jgi:hypothetical protein
MSAGFEPRTTFSVVGAALAQVRRSFHYPAPRILLSCASALLYPIISMQPPNTWPYLEASSPQIVPSIYLPHYLDVQHSGTDRNSSEETAH